MMNKDAYLNELSLQGQYKSIDEFLETNRSLIFVIRELEKKEYKLLKRYDLYNSMITETDNMYSLNGYRSKNIGQNNDVLRKLKIDFLKMCCVEPFWQPDENETVCHVGAKDVTGSSIARAAIFDDLLLSFACSEDYTDKKLSVDIEGDGVKALYSVNTSKLLAESLYSHRVIDGDAYLKLRYRHTRLDFSRLQAEYGSNMLEKDEFKECIKSFDRFISFDSWNEMMDDESLKYKAYSPSSKRDDWFANTEYRNRSIDKFRCVNPKRCYGYREGNVFYALRIERDHTISDNG